MGTGPVVNINPNVKLSRAQRRAVYKWTRRYLNGKPIFFVPTLSVIKFRSAFEHKLLCDGLTFTLGLACFFSCAFCYVYSNLCRHAAVRRIMKETGLSFDQIAIVRNDPLPVLRSQLLNRKGLRKYNDPDDRRVVYASPLVDIAANLETARQTIEACRLILQHTNWQIRLLSKSALLKMVAEALVEYKDRVIYGLSTGTFDDKLATSFERGTSSPTARLRSLHWMQDNGYRTFGMICPSLPQEDYDAFAKEAVSRIRADRCEHVWGEVINVRGKSLAATVAGLRAGGFEEQAKVLEAVSGAKHKAAWEQYARNTFLALSRVVSPKKLRFMQYVQEGKLDWWQQQKSLGALLLGKHAKVECPSPETAKSNSGGKRAVGQPTMDVTIKSNN